MNALIPRNTVEQIVSFRDAAVAAYQGAFDKIADADKALKEAAGLWKAASGDFANSYHGDSRNGVSEVSAFFNAVNLPEREQYERTAIRLIDISCWHYLVQMTDLDALMDRKAKDELRDSLKWVPERRGYDRRGESKGELVNLDEIMGIPPVTVENIYATIDKWAGEAEMIFRRGIATAFSSLDRRFRSHDGFKIGSRVILTYAFSEFGGSLNYGRTADTLQDIERTFCILDGKKPGLAYGGIVGQIRNERSYGVRQSEHHGEYFKVVGYKNGNAHLWFTRDDLVEKVNKMLAEYYGEVIGDGQTKQPDDLFRNIKTTPARNFGFFPTPDDAADDLIGGVSFMQKADAAPLLVLEPSAGTGNLARRCVFNEKPGTDSYGRPIDYTKRTIVDCVELQPALAGALESSRLYRKVYAKDFLSLTPEVTGLYDRIVMNPPFDMERDIDHVAHAMKFLKPDGELCAIMSAGTEFRETKKAIAFRALMTKLNAKWRDLPPASFSEVGTYVNTVMVRVRADGGGSRYW